MATSAKDSIQNYAQDSMQKAKKQIQSAKTALATKEGKRKAAKLGMCASLGGAIISGFAMKSPLAKTLHLASAAALVGFALWHHSLYPKQEQKKQNQFD